jgi:hypothetical protein
MRDSNRCACTGHAGEQDGRRLQNFNQTRATFELFGTIAHKAWPVCRTRHQVPDRREHLAAIADSEGELASICKELRELLGKIAMVQDRRRPAATGAEHVAITEATAGREPLITRESITAFDQIGHVYVVAVEPGAREGGRHLDFGVDALFAQDRELWAHTAVDIGRRGIPLRVERNSAMQCMTGIKHRITLGCRTAGIIAS